MISIANPIPDLDPAIKKQIARLTMLTILCCSSECILVCYFRFSSNPPRWTPSAMLLVMTLSSVLSGRVYKLRNAKASQPAKCPLW